MGILTAREILDRLVAFPTVSRVSNLALVDWLEGYLAGHGIRCFRHWNEDRQKAALIAHAGPRIEGAIVLSGHSDVVPVDGRGLEHGPSDRHRTRRPVVWPRHLRHEGLRRPCGLGAGRGAAAWRLAALAACTVL
ncbi:hypothetical protein MASR1M32_23840 [Rhodobacter sp.]